MAGKSLSDFIAKQAKLAYAQLKNLARYTALGAVIILGVAAMLAPEPSMLLTVLPSLAYAFFASFVIGVAASIAKTFLSNVGKKIGKTIGKYIGKDLFSNKPEPVIQNNSVIIPASANNAEFNTSTESTNKPITPNSTQAKNNKQPRKLKPS